MRRWRVEIDAECRLERDEDAYGNVTHTFSVDGPIESMRIAVEGEVDVAAEAGMVRGTMERFPLGYWTSETPLTAPDQAIRDFADDLAGQEGGDPLAFLHLLMTTIRSGFVFDADRTHSATSAREAFAQRAGVCQDFAQVFIAAARHRGLPARYVSGYFLRSDREDQEAGHAWAEAHVPGVGWVAFDPANGVCADERFIRVAVGRDSLEAAPIRGARLGGSGERLAVQIHLAQGRALAEQ